MPRVAEQISHSTLGIEVAPIFPELVPDTLPAIPADPFDEHPLRYRRLPQGFAVYSVGPDFTDNGGQRPPTGTEQGNGYDVVFSVER